MGFLFFWKAQERQAAVEKRWKFIVHLNEELKNKKKMVNMTVIG
jgi:hypothetical protein